MSTKQALSRINEIRHLLCFRLDTKESLRLQKELESLKKLVDVKKYF